MHYFGLSLAPRLAEVLNLISCYRAGTAHQRLHVKSKAQLCFETKAAVIRPFHASRIPQIACRMCCIPSSNWTGLVLFYKQHLVLGPRLCKFVISIICIKYRGIVPAIFRFRPWTRLCRTMYNMASIVGLTTIAHGFYVSLPTHVTVSCLYEKIF